MYILSESVANVGAITNTPIIVKIYKGGSLVYTSDALTKTNKSVTIPELAFNLSANEEVCIFFERQNEAGVTEILLLP